MKIRFLPFFFLHSFAIALIYGQKKEILYFNQKWEKTSHIDSAKYYRVITNKEDGKPFEMVNDYYITGEMQFKGKIISFPPDVLDSLCIWFNRDSSIASINYFIKGVPLIERIKEYTYDILPDSIDKSLSYLSHNLGIPFTNNQTTALLINKIANDLFMYNLDDAIKFYRLSISINKNLENSCLVTTTLFDWACSYLSMNDINNAIPLLERSIKITEKECKKDSVYFSMLNYIITSYLQLDNLYVAIPYIIKMGDYLKNDRNKYIEYNKFISKEAHECFRKAKYKEAELLFVENIKTSKEIYGTNNNIYADCLNDLGGLYNEIGNYLKAENLFNETEAIKEIISGIDSPDYANILNNIALLYLRTGRYRLSELLLKETLNIYVKSGENHLDYAVSTNNLAGVYYATGQYSKVETLLTQSSLIFKKIYGSNSAEYATSIANIAEFYSSIGNFKKAKAIFKETIILRLKILGDRHPDYINALNNMATLYFETNEMNNANLLFMQCRGNYFKFIIQNFSFLSETEKQQYLQTITPNFEILNSFYFHQSENNDSLKSAAYDDALALKGIVLQSGELVRNAIANSNDTALLYKYEEFTNTRKILSKLYSLPREKRWVNTDSLEDVANNLEKDFTRKAKNLQGFEGYTGLKVKWTDIQSKLKTDEAAIEFINFKYWNKRWTDSTLYCALSIRKDSKFPEMVYLFEEKQMDSISKGAGYNSNIYSTRGTTIIENPESLAVNGLKLYKLIWKPIEKSLPGIKTIYLSPSGLLHQISFSALPSDSSTLLSDRYDLHIVSSTRQLLTDIDSKPTNATLFGGIKYDAEELEIRLSTVNFKSTNTYASRSLPIDSSITHSALPYLKGSLDETNRIQTLMDSCKLKNNNIIGINASEESFKALSGTKPGIIHIATHGYFYPNVKQKHNDINLPGYENQFIVSQNPLFRSGLFMAGANLAWVNNKPIEGLEDGILTAYEISQLNLLGTELVVLSACETGLGDIKGNEGVFGLQRAFKMAGVNTIIMSLWNVPDQQTSELMVSFYKYWLSGQSKHNAFCNAQKEIRMKYTNPYYWAAFVMVD